MLVQHSLARADLAEPQSISALRAQLRQQSKGVLRHLDAIIERSLATSLAGKLNVTVLGGQMTVEGDYYQFLGPATGTFGRQQ